MATGDNSPKRTDIERIVRQVIAELAGGRMPQATSTATTTTTAAGDLVVSKRVVSLADVEGRLSGIARLVVERGAVFTPAARDELKQHGVTITSAVRTAGKTGKLGIALATAETKYEAKALLAALAADGINAETIAGTSLLGTVAALCARVKNEGLGMLVTGEPAAALCLANRQAGVRASLVANVAAVDAAVASIGTNLLVIEPTGKSVFELRQITRHWLRNGRPECPAALQKHLA